MEIRKRLFFLSVKVSFFPPCNYIVLHNSCGEFMYITERMNSKVLAGKVFQRYVIINEIKDDFKIYYYHCKFGNACRFKQDIYRGFISP